MSSDEDKKKEKKSKIMLIVKIIIILLIIHITLVLSKCTTTKEEYVTVEVPNTVEETVKDPVQNCVEREYNWQYNWEGWYDEGQGIITAAFRIMNLENKPGEFEVNFAFYDESKYKFKDYEGKVYSSVKDELPWDAADMWFEGFKKTLKPYDDILITPSATKKNPAASYWVYADVKAPTIRECTTDSFITTTVNRTLTIEKDVKQNVSYKVSLWDLLMSKVFG